MSNPTSFMLYVHWPFCLKKCRYCDFLSRPQTSPSETADYRDALIREIQAAEKPTNGDVTSVYFGGGTPSLVPAKDTEAVLEALCARFGVNPKTEDIECTIEVNPGAVTPDKLEAYRKMGFDRLSIGCQSTKDHLLKTLGRVHSSEDFFATVFDANAAGFSNLSVDLMVGLPGQTLDDVKTAVREVAALPNVRHLSCYSLIIEEGTPFAEDYAKGKLTLPDEETEREMVHLVTKEAKRHGFAQYEISNYARAGYESRHNSGYWRFWSYRGFGAGAASFNFSRRRRYANTASVSGYMRGDPLSEDRFLTADELRGDFMFLGLRRLSGVSDIDYTALFGRSIFDDYTAEIDNLQRESLIVCEGNRVRLSEKGLDFANRVFRAFI